jgi:PAS domain S-box-containing protein
MSADTDSQRVEELKSRLEHFEAALEALGRGEVDTLAAAGPDPLVDRLKFLVAELGRSKAEADRLAGEWQATFDAANDAIWTLDREFRILRCNATAARMFGRSSDEMAGRFCWEIVHGTDRPIPECPIIRVRESLSRETLELRFGERWFLAKTDPVLNASGGFAGAVHIIIDITDRKRAEEALRESEESYRTLFDKSIDAIIIHGLDGRILDVNEMACRQSGYSKEELLRLSVFDLHPLTADTVNMPRDEILAEWRRWPLHQRNELEAEHRRKDGTIFPVQISSGVIRSAGGARILAVVHDISERREAEAKIREQMEELISWHKTTLGRETRILELKREVNGLLAREGRPPRYSSAETEGES